MGAALLGSRRGSVQELVMEATECHAIGRSRKATMAGSALEGCGPSQPVLLEIGNVSRRRRSGVLQEIESVSGRSLVMPFGLIPDDNVPYRLQIVGSPILVEQIVRVLPDIDPENWLKTITYRVVLIRGGNNFE